MKVTGFTIIRNALIYDYPVCEAILSVLPLCDEFIVSVGKSEDKTLELIQSIDNPKIIIVESVWDDSKRIGGEVLAVETNKVIDQIENETDWVFYIQADEILHEKFHDSVKHAMHSFKNENEVDALLFNYLHFYGSYDYVGISSKWYAHEIRIFKPGRNIYSYRDAQGFRKGQNEKLAVKKIDACIYHYGWVKAPETMQKKQLHFNRLWHDDTWIEKNIAKVEKFDYSRIDSLKKFEGTHPDLMLQRIRHKNWTFEYELTYNKIRLKDRFKLFMKKYFGLDLNYKNYRIIP
jgi:hypothetical protein